MKIEVVMVARDEDIDQWVTQCAEGQLPFSVLCQRVSRRGYSINSLYEAVVARQRSIKSDG